MMILPEDFISYISRYSYLIMIFIMLQGSLIVILFYLFAERVVLTRKRRLDDQLVKQEAYDKAVKILEEARAASVRVIQEAQKKAQEIVSGLAAVDNSAKDSINTQIKLLSDKHLSTLEKAGDAFLLEYKQLLSEEKDKSLKELEETSTVVKDELLGELESFKDTLRKETYDTELQVTKKISDDYEVVKQELEKYKNDKISHINDHIFEIIAQSASESISKSLDIDSHQQLIIEILEKVKKEHSIGL